MKKVLIVEDDVMFLKLLSDVLSKQLQVYETCGVREALHNLEENTVDLICSDYNLPDGTGLELLEQLCRNGKSIPFLLMSGIEDSFVVNCVKFHGEEFCSKTGPDLLATIKRLANT